METPIALDQQLTGSTADAGWDIDFRDWAEDSSVACFPSTMLDEYRGPYQVYTFDIVGPAEWDIVVTPDAGVDVSVVAWSDQLTGGCAPITEDPVRVCDASNNPNDPLSVEDITFVSIDQTYRFKVLVTTPDTGTRGGYTIALINSP